MRRGLRAMICVGTGAGQYGAVGFSYGAGGGQSETESSEGDSSEEEDESDGGADEDEHADVDGLAANLGIDSFSVLLRRAEREEAEAAQGIFKKRKWVLLCQACCYRTSSLLRDSRSRLVRLPAIQQLSAAVLMGIQ